jgi:hypothetical protein
MRFAQDFRRSQGYRLVYALEVVDGQEYFRLRLRDACEFLSKKDYLDNWQSEMHETFCFWDLSEWRQAIERAGFAVHPASRAFTNDWVVKNRYEGKARLLRMEGSRLEALPWPVTTMVLIASKV